MFVRRFLALAGAVVALVLALSTVAGATSAPATIRIEGRTRTLVATNTVRIHSGTVRKGAHSCPASTAAGALNRVTGGHWSGKWFSGLGFEVYTILGETNKYTSTKSYWELFVNHIAASAGMCSVKLHPGEQLLFAAVSANGFEYPLGLTVLSKPVVGSPFEVKVVFYNARGKAKPLAGATVAAYAISAEPIPHSKITVKTNSQGVATLTEKRQGLIKLNASKHGYIRTAPVAENIAP